MNERRGDKDQGKIIALNYDQLAEFEDGDEIICVRMARRTREMILSISDYLGWRTRYVYDDGDNVRADDLAAIDDIKSWAAQAKNELMGDDDACQAEDECTNYEMSASMFLYSPASPYDAPNYIPPGYDNPPFYTGGSSIPGILTTDLMVDYFAIPVGANIGDLLMEGFPRVRVPFSGVGQIEIEFLMVPNGGLAYITTDGNPLNGTFVNLATIGIGDLIDLGAILDVVLGGGLTQSHIIERFTDTPGEHYIDITFLPNVNDDVLIGFGGGIRRIGFCAGAEPEGVGTTGMGIKDMRIVLGQIEVEYENSPGTWIAITNADFVRHDGSLTTDVTGQFVVQPLTDTPAAIIKRSALSALSDLFSLRSEADVPFWRVAYDGGIVTDNTGLTIRMPQASSRLQVGTTSGLISFSAGNTNLIVYKPTLFDSDSDVSFRGIPTSGGGSTQRVKANIQAGWLNGAAGTRRGFLKLYAHDWDSAKEALVIGSDGVDPIISVLGQSPAKPRQILIGDWQGNVAGKGLAEILEAFGWIYDNSDLGEPLNPPESETISERQCRIAGYVGSQFYSAFVALLSAAQSELGSLDTGNPATFQPILDAFPYGWLDEGDALDWLVGQFEDFVTLYETFPETFTQFVFDLQFSIGIGDPLEAALSLQSIRCGLKSSLIGDAISLEETPVLFSQVIEDAMQGGYEQYALFWTGVIAYMDWRAVAPDAAAGLVIDTGWTCDECDECDQFKTVTFDDGGYPYTITIGALGVGYSGSGVDDTGTNLSRSVEVEVLKDECWESIDLVKAQIYGYRHTQTHGFAFTVDWYRENDTFETTTTVYTSGFNGGWINSVTFSRPGSVDACVKVRVRAGMSTASGSTPVYDVRMDNIVIYR